MKSFFIQAFFAFRSNPGYDRKALVRFALYLAGLASLHGSLFLTRKQVI